jgi:3-hydroxybutyryl-CoA dehydrogenase
MKVLVLGAGLMGAQIGVEYLVAGHDVTFSARDTAAVTQRVRDGLALAERLGRDVGATGSWSVSADPAGDAELIVESLPENLSLKARLLAPLAAAAPDAIVATNTSSLPIAELGAAVGAPERTIGTHYWNPPLLMPLVEVIPGTATYQTVVDRVVGLIESLGKQVVLVERDVPGFIWNRLQLAVMREAVWLAENGVASPATIDTAVREGLARRWRHVGPFAAAALGGVTTWRQVGENLLPELSRAENLAGLERWLETDEAELRRLRDTRDAALADEL